jgi:phosphonate transport system substrate-binding protein
MTAQKLLRFPRRSSVLAIFLVFVLLAACSNEPIRTVSLTENLIGGEVPPPIPTGTSGWVFGFDRRLEPKDDVRQIASLISWLEAKTGLAFLIYATPPGKSVVDDICAERVDFAVVGTVSYLQASHQCGARILVRGLNLNNQDRYQAAIIVPVDSPIQEVADLRGHSFAFGAPNSTQGYLIPRLMLQQVGLTLDDLYIYAFHDSHAATANSVTSGRFDAGAVQDTLAFDLAERGLVRILALSDFYPSSGIVVGAHVPQKTVLMIRDALLELDPLGKDASSLYQWDRTEMPGGFAPATDEDYDELRQAAELIGLLDP